MRFYPTAKGSTGITELKILRFLFFGATQNHICSNKAGHISGKLKRPSGQEQDARKQQDRAAHAAQSGKHIEIQPFRFLKFKAATRQPNAPIHTNAA